MKTKKLIISLAACACLGLLGVGGALCSSPAQADDTATYYTLGNKTTGSERIEAEDLGLGYTKYSAYQTVDGTATVQSTSVAYGNSKSPTFTVNMEEAGTYAIKIAYYLGCNSNATFDDNYEANFVVTANSGTSVTGHDLKWNGYDNDYKGYAKSSNRRACFYETISGIELVAGENSVNVAVTLGSSVAAVHVDFFEFYKADDVYYYDIERNLGMAEGIEGLTVGERIEVEWGYPVNFQAASYSNYILGTVGYQSGGYSVGLGTSTSGAATLTYTVTAEEEGDYYIQIVNGAASGAKFSDKWTVAQGEWSQEYEFTFDGTTNSEIFAGTGKVIYAAWRNVVHLKKGVNTIYYTLGATTAAHQTDFFKIIPMDGETDVVRQFEDYAINRTRIAISEESYAVLDEWGAEVRPNETLAGFNIPVTVEKAGYYDVFMRLFANYAAGSEPTFKMSVNDGDAATYSVDNSDGNSGLGKIGTNAAKAWLGDNFYRVYLEEGDNVVYINTISKTFTFDWFYITETKITAEEFEVDCLSSVDVGTEVTVDDTAVAKYENGKLVGLKGGTTVAKQAIVMNNGYTYYAKYPVTVNKIAYTGTDITAANETVSYNGTVQTYNAGGDKVSAPQGWSISYSNNDGITDPGSASITVKLTHDVYTDVVKEATFTVVKAVYTGDDLIANDVSGYYDGETAYSVEATAPEGWDIHYSTNERTVVGTTEVPVTFSHVGYEDVQKTARITVSYPATAEFASVSLEGEIGLNFYFSLVEEVVTDSTAKCVFTVGEATTEVALAEAVKNGDYYVFTYRLAAKDYKTVVKAEIVSSVGLSSESSCSIESYAAYVEEHKTETEYAECAELVAAMKDYCEAARIYFTGENATEGFTDVTAVTLEGYKATATGTCPSDVKILGATLILEDQTTVRVYFTATSTVVDGAVSVAGVENCYYLEVRDIAAKDLDSGYEFAIGDYKITVGALSYAHSVVNDSTSEVALKNVVKALYLYNAAANEYWNTEG